MSYASTILADSPVAYWKLDETSGTTATDSSGNSRNATWVGSPTLGMGHLIKESGAAAFLDGSTAYLDCPVAAMNAIVAGTGAFTWECWFSPSNPTVKQMLYGANRGSPPVNNGPQVYYSHPSFGGAGFFSVFDSTAFNEFISTSAFIATVVFVVLRVAADGSCTLRVNGAAQGSAGANSSMLVASNDTFQVGMDWDAGPVTSDFLFGTVDEVAIFGSSLSDAQVDAHYAAGQVAMQILGLRDDSL